MMRCPRSLAFPLGALALLAGVSACGEEGKAIGDACEEVPLYRLGYDDASKTWKRYAADGGLLSAEDNARVDDEQNRSGRRCLSPLGTAISSSTGGASPGGSGSGGASSGGSGSGGVSPADGGPNDAG